MSGVAGFAFPGSDRAGCFVGVRHKLPVSGITLPPPEISNPLQPPPPQGGTVTTLFCKAISIAAVCVPHLSHRFLHCDPITSNQSGGQR